MNNTKLVSAIVVDGKTLIKKDGKSELPFGCEYSLYMKNLENRKVSISVSIDGKDILNGNKIILDSNEDIKLERFLEDLDEGRKLRFIQKTKEIENFRGNRAEDGIIVINYTYERERHSALHVGGISSADLFGSSLGSVHSKYASIRSNSVNSTLSHSGDVGACFNSSVDTSCSVETQSLSSEKGITVEGSKSEQKFNRAWIGDLEYKTHVDTIELFGYESKVGIEVACETIFVKQKFCPSCGKHYQAGKEVDYCLSDGTYLKETINGVEVKQQIC